MLLTVLVACASDPRDCEGYSEPEDLGAMETDELDETSGLALSPAQGVLWAHNDSGDEARIFAIGLDGSHRGIWQLAGVDVQDVEDIAFDTAGRLVLADIGDNRSKRDSVRLLRFAEPDVSTGGGTIEGVEVFELTYSDRPQDAEALAIDPTTGEHYVFEKDHAGRISVHRADLATGSLDRVLKFNLPGDGDQAITAADFTPDGERLMLRTKDRVFVYSRSGQGDLGALLDSTPCLASAPDEEQGEALAAASWGFVTVSEGQNPHLHRANRL